MKYFIYSVDYGCTYGESKGGLDFEEAMDIIKCLEKKVKDSQLLLSKILDKKIILYYNLSIRRLRYENIIWLH